MANEPVILGDWGGTRLRLWLRQGGATLAASEASGLLVAQQDAAEVLRAALGRLGVTPHSCRIVLCGMAGARDGLAETRYVSCPAGAQQWVDAALETALDGVPVTVLPGFADRDSQGRPDVMRGEETQVFGALAAEAYGGGPIDIVLPGTHSKWVRAEEGRIARFATCPTGEIHARLLGSSMAPAEPGADDRGHAKGFTAGVDRARQGSPLIASLFEARAARMLDRRTGDWSRGFVSGLLIGNEIAAVAPAPSRDAAPLLLIGSEDLVRLYRTALAAFGLDCRTIDGESCALAGLEIAHARLG